MNCRKVKRVVITAIPMTVVLAGALLSGGCFSVGPDYERPETETPAEYKAEAMGEWKEGEPLDHLPKGRWWEVYGDEQLNELQDRALAANQELKAAFAVVNQSRAVARAARSEFFPTMEFNPSYNRSRFSANQEPDFGAITADSFSVPLDLSYEIDLWGRVRRGFESAQAEVMAGDAAFHNVLLTLQADVAQNYFALRTADAELAVLRRAIELRREQLDIVTSRFDSGLGNALDVARAETELAIAEAELSVVERRRSELENALALLVGESPSSFSLQAVATADEVRGYEPPAVPAGLPSALLERRPDVAEAERQLAASNAQIGVAKAAFFPAVRLTASGGFLSAEATDVFDWQSRVWSWGPSVSLPIFAGGRNKANLERSRAVYEEAVARYRQQILVAFGDVENALAAVRILSRQSEAQQRAVDSAIRARDLATESFSIGLTDFLSVIDADRAAVQSVRTDVLLAGERMIASVVLIKSLGGGWTDPRYVQATE